MNLYFRLLVVLRLGFGNCVAVAAHRIALRSRFYQFRFPQRLCPVVEKLQSQPLSPVFPDQAWVVKSRSRCLSLADALIAGSPTWFSYDSYQVGSPPDWFLDPVLGQRFPDASQHWSQCHPFLGSDIKRCWELSRWGWAPLLIRAWRISGDNRFRDCFNSWTESWCQANPLNSGSNWCCGQEASIRLLHALQAWMLADAPNSFPTPRHYRQLFVAAHLQRISATKRYAQAQDNNHWTSEAAALFIGGSWLVVCDQSHRDSARRWARSGRIDLEQSVTRLVMADGSFAQHSLNYHRLLLETLVQVELWRRWLDQERFSSTFYDRCLAATNWLATVVDPISGDGPNLGSNDGAHCYHLCTEHFRDFRSTLQLASVVFNHRLALPSGPWDEPLYWLGLPVADSLVDDIQVVSTAQFRLFPSGGYAVFRPANTCWALLRLPHYRFRPSHSDPFHLDLWHQGVNLLRDGGSYSYNASPCDLTYFPGIVSHNTVQFDGAEPMPRLGRFLWGNWLQLEAQPLLEQTPLSTSFIASYCCAFGRHQRQVQVDDNGHRWRITDTCSGFQHQSVLRWRLCPGDWKLDGCLVIGPLATLEIHCDQQISRIEMTVGFESLHYDTKSALPVLEVCVASGPATFITSIQLSS